MIPANQLRPGNLIIGNTGIETVRMVHGHEGYKQRTDINEIYKYLIGVEENRNQYNLAEIKPVPLSEEILFKFEYQISENFGDQIYYQVIPQDEARGYGVCHDHDEWTFYAYDGSVIRTLIYDQPFFQHAHHLQNIIFSLTGEELPFTKL